MSCRSFKTQEKFKINFEFWDGSEDYQNEKQIVRSLKVINDIAERGIKYINDFNAQITKDEEQKQ